jgi:non-ribosomal peptide synthetase component E (peptide arylation enzyme)
MTSVVENQAVCLADYLEWSAGRVPKRTAVADPDFTETSCHKLDSCEERVAASLETRGVQPGNRIAGVLPTIELDDIERGLYRHDCTRKAAVVAVETAGADLKIVADLEGDCEPRPGALDMRRFCARYLPAHMSPDVFAFAKTLPRSSTDSADYQALKRLFLKGIAPGAATT